MGAETLIAFHRVHEGIQSLGLPMEQCVTAEMLRQCKFGLQSLSISLGQNEKGNRGKLTEKEKEKQ